MKKRLFPLLAVVLTLCLTIGSASALTADQFKSLLQNYYIDNIPSSTLNLTSVDDIVKALGDPYTTYFTKDEYASFMASMQDSTKVGLGVAISTASDGWQVTQVLSGTGAEKAGVKVGEIITAVNGTSVAGISVDDASKYLSGDEGTTLTITLKATDGSTRTVTATRTSFTATLTASTEVLKNHIGYIDCSAFGSETLQHFKDGITTNDAAANIWLVNLQLNGGGDASVAANCAATLTGGSQSPLAYLKDRSGQYGGYSVTDKSLTSDRSIVLVSEYTASAAEMFSSIVRDLNKGIIVGNRTYGKGVAQIVFDSTTNPTYFTDGDAVKLTAYRVYSYDGTTTDKIGVIPDLLISDKNAAGAAVLLCSSAPTDSKDYIKLTLGGLDYYISLADAKSTEASLAAFTELLEAIPPSAPVYLGDGGSDWVNVGANVIAQTYCPDYTSRTFTDVSQSSYKDAVNTLATYGILKGTETGTFNPQGTLTRAQLCAMLTQILNHTGSASVAASAFSDISKTAWYADDVAMMYQMGLVKGYSDGTFHPDDIITHEQLISICERFSAWLNASINAVDSAVTTGTAKADTTAEAAQGFSSWSTNSAFILNYYQLLYTDLDQINPTGATHRDEAAEMLYKILYGVGELRA
jgi:carboxyl-terminal processing protease